MRLGRHFNTLRQIATFLKTCKIFHLLLLYTPMLCTYYSKDLLITHQCWSTCWSSFGMTWSWMARCHSTGNCSSAWRSFLEEFCSVQQSIFLLLSILSKTVLQYTFSNFNLLLHRIALMHLLTYDSSNVPPLTHFSCWAYFN